jgi:hypothetical protein
VSRCRVGGNAAESAFVGEVGGNRGRGLGEDRDAASRRGLPQPGAQLVAESDTRDQWLDLLPTMGGLTQLPPDETAGILGTVRAAIDTLGGRFTMHYTTLATTAVRAGTS